MDFAILEFLENKSIVIVCFVTIMKMSYRNDPAPITALAHKGQDLQVHSRPLSRGYTVLTS